MNQLSVMPLNIQLLNKRLPRSKSKNKRKSKSRNSKKLKQSQNRYLRKKKTPGWLNQLLKLRRNQRKLVESRNKRNIRVQNQRMIIQKIWQQSETNLMPSSKPLLRWRAQLQPRHQSQKRPNQSL